MNTIRMENVKEEIKLLNKRLEKVNRIGKNTKIMLEKLGYTESYLGTGKSAYICSKQVKVMDIKSIKHLNGKYLAIGQANTFMKKGNMYNGFVKEIV